MINESLFNTVQSCFISYSLSYYIKTDLWLSCRDYLLHVAGVKCPTFRPVYGPMMPLHYYLHWTHMLLAFTSSLSISVEALIHLKGLRTWCNSFYSTVIHVMHFVFKVILDVCFKCIFLMCIVASVSSSQVILWQTVLVLDQLAIVEHHIYTVPGL